MRKRTLAAALLLAVIGPGLIAADSQPKPAPKTYRQCFFMNNWSGWRPSPDARSIYLRVNVNEIWRLDLTDSCPELTEPYARLITHSFSDTVCDALDLDLKVSNGPPDMAVPCIIKGVTRLSDTEAKALPKKELP